MNCLHCGTPSADGQKFCGECGARLEAAVPVADGERNYTPPHLAELILKSRSALEGERKQVTVLFCDIADSTPMAARIGADRMHKTLNAFFEIALAEVHRFEGTVNQFLGDGFMALFGAPVTHEDHARRAALAALAVRKAIASNQTFGAPDIALKTRIGLNTGAVVVGRIGDNLRMDYTAVGDTTNVAARIQALAEPGSILVSENVAHAVRRFVDCMSVGMRTLKGKSEPVHLYQLVAERAHAARPIASDAERLVGREAERAEIVCQFQRLESGEGGLLSVVGEAGLGKSRLLREASRIAEERGLRLVQGGCLSFGRTLSYWSFREAILAVFGITEGDSEAAGWSKLEDAMARLFGPGADELLPYIGTLLALNLPKRLAERIQSLDSLSMGHQIFRCTLLLFESLARERPTVVVLEDWHWADASSADLLAHVLPLVEREPLLFLIASRPETQGAAASLAGAIDRGKPAADRVRVVRLAPLLEVHGVELSEQLAGGSLPRQVRDMLLRRAGGNPFYLGELVRALVSTKAIERGASGAWRVTETFGSVALPESIEGVILARIDRLEDEVKQVIKAASVVGRSFFYRVLKAIADSDAALDDDLVKLRTAELIDQKQLAPELEYIFKHPLIQQATYDSMLADRRRDLHREVGRCIEQLFADRLEPFYSMLAYHFVKAADEVKGLEYLQKAADHADRLAADEEALELYGAVIEALDRQSAGSLDPLRRAELESKLGEAHFRAGRHDQALMHFSRALSRVDPSAGRSRWAMNLSVAVGFLWQTIRPWIPDAWRPHQRAMTASESLACQIWESMGWINFFIDIPRACYGAMRMARLSATDTHSRAYVVSLSHIGMMCTTLGLYRTASWALARARRLAGQSKDPFAQATADHLSAWHMHDIGQWSEAIKLDQAAAVKCWDQGSLRIWAATQIDQALFFNSLGIPYREHVDHMFRIITQTPDSHARAWSLTVIAMERERRGDYEAALQAIDEAAIIYRRIPDQRTLAMALGIRCANLLNLERTAEAQDSGAEAMQIIKQERLTGKMSTLCLMAWAELRLHQLEADPKDRVRLRSARQAVKRMLRQGGSVKDEGAVECRRLAGNFEWLGGSRERAQASWSRGLDEARLLGARYSEARILFDRGRRAGQGDDLRQAARLFEASGAQRELLAAEALLDTSGQASATRFIDAS